MRPNIDRDWDRNSLRPKPPAIFAIPCESNELPPVLISRPGGAAIQQLPAAVLRFWAAKTLRQTIVKLHKRAIFRFL